MRRWHFHVAALALGAMVALLVYGFGVRGMGVNHGLRSPYTVVAMILLIIARRLTRNVDAEEAPRVGVMFVVGLLGAAAAVAISLSIDTPLALRGLSTHRLPGFTVDLPGGREQLSGGAYSSGNLSIEIDRDAAVSVLWIPGNGSRQELETMSAGVKIGAADRLRSSRIAPIDGRDTFVMDVDDGKTLYLTTTPCDGRTVGVQSMGLSERMHMRIVRSIECKPEPHASERVAVEFDAAGLTLVEEKEGHILYYADDASALLFAATVPISADPGTLRDASSAMLAGQGFESVQIEPKTPDTFAFNASVNGHHGAGLVRGVSCGRSTALLVSFATDNALASRADALAKSVATAHCR